MTPIEICRQIEDAKPKLGWYAGMYEGKSPSQVESEVGTNVMDSTKARKLAEHDEKAWKYAMPDASEEG